MDTSNNGASKTEHAACKEEKQKYNEDILILESSSLSSETGSWESVFPSNPITKNITSDFIDKEKEYSGLNTEKDVNSKHVPKHNTAKACFIDASTLVDEETPITKPVPPPSLPIPCTSTSRKRDDSCRNVHDDSPHTIVKELDSISPTLSDTTPGYEDSITKDLERTNEDSNVKCIENITNDVKPVPPNISLNMIPDMRLNTDIDTPFNSIMSLKSSSKLCTNSSQTSINVDLAKNHRKDCIVADIHTGISNRSLESQSDYGDDLSIASSCTHDDVEVSSRGSRGSFAWVIDATPKNLMKKPRDKAYERLTSEELQRETSKSRTSLASDSSDRSGHTFYIDLSSLPDPLPPEKPEPSATEKTNIFSMYIELGDNKTKSKGVPARLSSSFQAKKLDSTYSSEYFSMSNEKTSPRSNKSTNASVCGEKPSLESSGVLNQTWTFEEYEELCNKNDFKLSQVLSKPVTKNKSSHKAPVRKSQNQAKTSEPSKPGTKPAVTVISAGAFVRLSDLDKPNRPELLKSEDKREKSHLMSRSIPEDSWDEHGHIGLSGSFHSENALSLNRLFPHLSKSLPGSLSVGKWPFSSSSSGGRPSPDISTSDTNTSRYSTDKNISEDVYPSCLISQCQSKLGQDLLRMFLEKIAPDVVVDVAGVRIKAHKCILSSRCQYFAAILSGGLVQSSGNVIVMPPFSYNVFHFALCHIYSGISVIPESVNIVELASLTDMLGLEGLKEAITSSLVNKYCHHFHEPCIICIPGVLQCFPLSLSCGLDDLYVDCLTWITRHFVTVWPNRSFATLSKTLLDKCYNQLKNYMTVDNIVDVVCGCHQIMLSLSGTRWSSSVVRMCRSICDAAAQFVAPQLSDVLTAVLAQPSDVGLDKQALVQDLIQSAIEIAPPDQVCYVYEYLSRSMDSVAYQFQHKQMPFESDQPNSDLTMTFGSDIIAHCEAVMVKNSVRIASCLAFKRLPVHMRLRLHQLGCMVYDTKQNTSIKPAQTPSKPKSTITPTTIKQIKSSLFVPYMPTLVLSQNQPKERNFEVRRQFSQTKPKKQPEIRMTKAQQQRMKHNLEKANQLENTNKKKPQSKARTSSSRTASQDKLMSSSQSTVQSTATHRSSQGSQTGNMYATFTKKKHDQKPSKETKPSSNQNLIVSKQTSRANGTAFKSRIPAPISQNVSKRNSKIQEPRNSAGTFMTPTKASQAKTVVRAKKSPQGNNIQKESVMQRSNTFLKSQSSFEESTPLSPFQ